MRVKECKNFKTFKDKENEMETIQVTNIKNFWEAGKELEELTKVNILIAKYLHKVSKLVIPTAPGNVQELRDFCVCQLLSLIWHFATPWTCQAPLSIEFSMQEY